MQSSAATSERLHHVFSTKKVGTRCFVITTVLARAQSLSTSCSISNVLKVSIPTREVFASAFFQAAIGNLTRAPATTILRTDGHKVHWAIKTDATALQRRGGRRGRWVALARSAIKLTLFGYHNRT